MSRALLAQALDLLEPMYGSNANICNAIRAHLAQPQAEPVAWMLETTAGKSFRNYDAKDNDDWLPLFATPQQAQPTINHRVIAISADRDYWRERCLALESAAPAVPLTDEQIEQLRLDICDLHILGHMAAYKLAHAAIAKFCEVNGIGIAAPGSAACSD